MSIYLIDNNDSFTRNLEHILFKIWQKPLTIISYEDLQIKQIKDGDTVIISPGPGNPAMYPKYKQLFKKNICILGVCLGMQIINEAFGGKTKPLKTCLHGKTDTIIFKNKKYVVARYHSLYTSNISKNFKIIATNQEKIPMIIENKIKPILAYQFHPESFLTKQGEIFIKYAYDLFQKNN